MNIYVDMAIFPIVLELEQTSFSFEDWILNKIKYYFTVSTYTSFWINILFIELPMVAAYYNP